VSLQTSNGHFPGFDGASWGEREGLTGGRARARDMEKAKGMLLVSVGKNRRVMRREKREGDSTVCWVCREGLCRGSLA
jgi:hypothetical protein